VFAIAGIAAGLVPGGTVSVTATDPDSGHTTTFDAIVRLNSPVELEYLQNGGILPRVLRMFARSA
jgi:aconitate hydratase